jgi:hypothetical protein
VSFVRKDMPNSQDKTYVGERLSHCENIRVAFDREGAVGPKRSGSSKTALRKGATVSTCGDRQDRNKELKAHLNFVKDEKSSNLVATLAKRAQEWLGRLEDTSLSLRRRIDVDLSAFGSRARRFDSPEWAQRSLRKCFQ